MREFLMEVKHFFLGDYRFQVVAEDRADAIVKGTEWVCRNLGKDNCYIDTVKVVRELKPSFGKEN